MAAVELAIRQLDIPEVGGVCFDEVIEAGEHIPGMAALWNAATAEERREIVMILLEPGGFYCDLEQKIVAALKPRPAFLPILRMLGGVVEYDETKGLLVTECWQDRNRREFHYLQEYLRDRLLCAVCVVQYNTFIYFPFPTLEFSSLCGWQLKQSAGKQ